MQVVLEVLATQQHWKKQNIGIKDVQADVRWTASIVADTSGPCGGRTATEPMRWLRRYCSTVDSVVDRSPAAVRRHARDDGFDMIVKMPSTSSMVSSN
jgi:hypothetical protein